MRRRLVASILLVFLVGASGCAALGPGPVQEDMLSEEVTYTWNTGANATITIERDRFKAVYSIRNQTTFEAYRFTGFNDRGPIDPIGLEFRNPNGTTIQLTSSAVTKHGERTEIDLPASRGQLAFAVQKQGKRIALPVLIEGSHEVMLPPGSDAEYPILSHITPGDYERVERGDVVVLFWEDPTGERLSIRYYLYRDILLLGSLVAIGGIALLVGAVHYWLRIRALEARREAIDVDHEENGGV